MESCPSASAAVMIKIKRTANRCRGRDRGWLRPPSSSGANSSSALPKIIRERQARRFAPVVVATRRPTWRKQGFAPSRQDRPARRGSSTRDHSTTVRSRLSIDRGERPGAISPSKKWKGSGATGRTSHLLTHSRPDATRAPSASPRDGARSEDNGVRRFGVVRRRRFRQVRQIRRRRRRFRQSLPLRQSRRRSRRRC